MDWIRKQLDAGRVDLAVAALKPHRDRSEAVAACIRTCEANRDRMRAIPAGRAACRSKAGANAVFAIRCCFENMRWPDFLDWSACRAAAA